MPKLTIREIDLYLVFISTVAGAHLALFCVAASEKQNEVIQLNLLILRGPPPPPSLPVHVQGLYPSQYRS